MVGRGLSHSRSRQQRSIFPVGALVVGVLLIALITRSVPGQTSTSVTINSVPDKPKADQHYRRGAPPKSDYASEAFFRRSSVRPSNLGVTLSAHLRIDQLKGLRSLGSSWGGHISAGVFISETKNSSLAKLSLAELADFHAKVEGEKSFHLDLGVVFGMPVADRALTEARELYEHQYPVNAIRNVALVQVETDLVFLPDVDMVVSADMLKDTLSTQRTSWGDGLHEIRKNPPHGKIAGVVPVFDCVEGSPMPNSRNKLIQLYETRKLIRFGGDRDRSHCGTDHGKWVVANSSYFVDYHEGYAPVVIAQASSLPWYPENIKGNTSCRSTHSWYMAATGWEFLVLPFHFMIHPRNPELEKAEVQLPLDSHLLNFSRTVTREFQKQVLGRPGVHNPIEVYAAKPRAYTPMSSIINVRNLTDDRQFEDEINCLGSGALVNLK